MGNAARLLDVLERIAVALERQAPTADVVDVEGAAALLCTTPKAIRLRHQRGKMPPPIHGQGKRLLWRRADLLRGA